MLTNDRNTAMRDTRLMVAPVASNAVIHAGALVVANATGFAAPGTTALNLTYLGRADEAVDNTGGADGDQVVNVRRNQAFFFKNDGVNAVNQSHMGKTCYIVDDETVAGTDGAGSRSAAGIVTGVEANGIWVE